MARSWNMTPLVCSVVVLALINKTAAERYIAYPKAGFFGTARMQNVFNSFNRLETVYRLDSIEARALDIPNAEEAQALRDHPLIERLEKDQKRFPVGGNQTHFLRRVLQTAETTPYGVKMVGGDVTPLYPGTSRSSLAVCVIDSGVDATHEDLRGANLAGYSANWNTDDCGHGSHVTGTIAAVKDNGKGVRGVGAGVAIYSVKVFDGKNCGWSWTSDLLAAAEKCRLAANGARLIINLSLGGPDYSAAERDGFASLWNQGILTVAAAGNAGGTAFSYPASYPSVISVGAVDANMVAPSFSQRNSQVDLAAPGVRILSTAKGGYANYDGTSMATPHVAGAAAVVWSYGLRYGWANVHVRSALYITARDLGDNGRDNIFGYGLVNACKAARLAGFDVSRRVICPGEVLPTTKPAVTTAAPTTTKAPTTAAPITTKAPTTTTSGTTKPKTASFEGGASSNETTSAPAKTDKPGTTNTTTVTPTANTTIPDPRTTQSPTTAPTTVPSTEAITTSTPTTAFTETSITPTASNPTSTVVSTSEPTTQASIDLPTGEATSQPSESSTSVVAPTTISAIPTIPAEPTTTSIMDSQPVPTTKAVVPTASPDTTNSNTPVPTSELATITPSAATEVPTSPPTATAALPTSELVATTLPTAASVAPTSTPAIPSVSPTPEPVTTAVPIQITDAPTIIFDTVPTSPEPTSPPEFVTIPPTARPIGATDSPAPGTTLITFETTSSPLTTVTPVAPSSDMPIDDSDTEIPAKFSVLTTSLPTNATTIFPSTTGTDGSVISLNIVS